MSLAEPPRKAATVDALPAQSRQFSWTERWFPVIYENDFDASRPYPFVIWETRLVMFRQNNGNYAVMEDVCTHRAAPLSEGRLTTSATGETVLECPYHGWSFNCSGSCVKIPQLRDDQKIPKAANMKKSYPTQVRDGIIFVWYGTEGKGNVDDVPSIRCEKQKEGFVDAFSFHDVSRMVPYDFITVVENVADPEHLKWSHHGLEQTFDRDLSSKRAEVVVRKVEKHSGEIVVDFENCDTVPRTHTRLMIHGVFDIHYKQIVEGLGEIHTRVLTTPRGRDQTVAFISTNVYTTKYVWPLKLYASRPRWLQHWHISTFSDGDTSLLRAQQRHLERVSKSGKPEWRESFFFSKSQMDSAVIAYRKWLDNYLDSIPWKSEQAAPSVFDSMPREQILDRYNCHTKNCKACMGALKNMQFLKSANVVVTAMSAVYLLSSSAVVFGKVANTNINVSTLPQAIASAVSGPFQLSILFAAGFCTCGLALVPVLNGWLERFFFSERAYELSHGK